MTKRVKQRRYTTPWYDFSLDVILNDRECTFAVDVYDNEFGNSLFYSEGYCSEQEAVEAGCQEILSLLIGDLDVEL